MLKDGAGGAQPVAVAPELGNVDGRPLDFAHGRTLQHNRGVLASNGPVHERLLVAVRDALRG